MNTIIRRMPRARSACGVLLLGVALHAGVLGAQEASTADPLATVKDRYATAAYDGALALLDEMNPAESDAPLRAEIEKYRALCYLALRRNAEADKAIEAFVTVDPDSAVDKLEASTWVRDRFRAVRRKVLPGIVTKRYEEAKSAVLAKSYEKAVPQLKEVLRLLDDPDLVAAMDSGSRSDLRTLTQGFLDLAEAATPPPAPPPKPAPAQPAPAPGSDRVIPPVTIQQDVPPWPPDLTTRGATPREGLIVVEIDEKGTVTSAVVRVSVHPMYDRLLQSAAMKWQYKPATKGGVPVPFTKPVRIVVNIGSTGGVESR